MFQFKMLDFNAEELLSNHYTTLTSALDWLLSPLYRCRLILSTSKEVKRRIRMRCSGPLFENQDWCLELITHKPRAPYWAETGDGEVCSSLAPKPSQAGAALALRDAAPGCGGWHGAPGGQRKWNPARSIAGSRCRPEQDGPTDLLLGVKDTRSQKVLMAN